jgi:formylglycine-generating enzyme required for sulfatase activity
MHRHHVGVDVSGAVSAPSPGVCVVVPHADYRLGDAGERVARLGPVALGRYPVTVAAYARFVAASGRPVRDALAARLRADALADHPVTEVTYEDAVAFCAWVGARLPTGDEWEAAARGTDGRHWPWGHTYDPERCNAVEAAWGWTVPVDAHPLGAGPCGAEQLAGNVWEWVGDAPDEDGWRTVRGGSYLDTAWGVRAGRSLPADPARATATTGFRIVVERGEEQRDRCP